MSLNHITTNGTDRHEIVTVRALSPDDLTPRALIAICELINEVAALCHATAVGAADFLSDFHVHLLAVHSLQSV